MNFMQLLNSLDELLYAVMSWLVFYPITLWRVLTGPLRAMAYADRELDKDEDKQFEEAISPPLFLVITLLLTHLISQSLFDDDALIADKHGLAALVTDQTSLIMVRLLFFGFFPLLMAVRLLRARRTRFTQAALKLPFYSQCYVTGPFALSLALATIGLHFAASSPAAALAGLGMLLLGSIWYLVVEARWFAKQLEVSFLRGLGQALRASIECGFALLLVLLLV